MRAFCFIVLTHLFGAVAVLGSCSDSLIELRREGNLHFALVPSGRQARVLVEKDRSGRLPMARYASDLHLSFALHEREGIELADADLQELRRASLALNLGNLFVNAHHMMWKDGRLFASSVDLDNVMSGVPYRGILRTKEGQFISGALILKQRGGDKTSLWIRRNGTVDKISEQVDWAVMGPPIFRDSKALGLGDLKNLVALGAFVDPRHLVRMAIHFPPNEEANPIPGYHGMSFFTSDPLSLVRAIQGEVVRIPLQKYMQWLNLDWAAVETAYVSQGYKLVDRAPRVPGEFRIIREGEGFVDVALETAVYPHVLLGATAKHELFVGIVDGQSGRAGDTLLNISQRLQALSIELCDVILPCNGSDTWLLSHGERVGEASQAAVKRRLHTTSALIIP